MKNDNSGRGECKHEVCELFVTRAPEENPGHCRKGCHLRGTRRASCSREFAAHEKKQDARGRGLSFRASSDTPTCCCINVKGGGRTSSRTMLGKCDHALRCDCWRAGISKKAPGQNKKRARLSGK